MAAALQYAAHGTVMGGRNMQVTGDVPGAAEAYVERTIGDTGVTVRAVGFRTEPSPVSDAKGPGFAAVERSLREVYSAPDLIVTPYMGTGGTDARVWSGTSTQTFRFLAVPMPADALTRAHGTNERVSVDGYLTAVRFFDRLLRNTDQL